MNRPDNIGLSDDSTTNLVKAKVDHIYFYKMTTDNGGAPCVYRGALTLAICKPAIRRKAKAGDFILGFGGKDLDGKLIYAARIARVVADGNYYRDGEGYANRPDSVYCWRSDELVFRKGSRFHNADCRDTDVGPAGNHYRRANVLLANEFVYFGRAATTNYQKTSPLLKKALDRLTQGHRINHTQGLEKELIDLYQSCIRKYGQSKTLGPPNHKPDNRILCSKTEGKEACVTCLARATREQSGREARHG